MRFVFCPQERIVSGPTSGKDYWRFAGFFKINSGLFQVIICYIFAMLL